MQKLKIDPEMMNRRLQRLNDLIEDVALRECYKNKLLYNCKYHPNIEKNLKNLEKIVNKEDDIPWYHEYLD